MNNQTCFSWGWSMEKIWKRNITVFKIRYLVEIFSQFYPEEFEVKKHEIGRPREYDLKDLLTFVFWGKENDKESCRDLEDWQDNGDETYKYVLNCKKPNRTSINNFKNNQADLIDKFDQFIIDFAIAIGLIDGKIVYGDGTILKAWCNSFKTMYPYEIEYLKTFLHNNVSNEELWPKLQRYFLKEDEDEDLKNELIWFTKWIALQFKFQWNRFIKT